MNAKLEVFIGNEINNNIDDVARLRIEEFRNFPYLYDGNLEYEKNYLKCYADDIKSTLALAKVNNTLAGVSTGIPLISNSEIVSGIDKIFLEHNLNPDSCYYYGEIIIKPEFRGIGLASLLYKAQDEVIKNWGYKQVCILTVVREIDHPMQPSDYKQKDGMWEHLGFKRLNIIQSHHWPTIQPNGSVVNIKNDLEFWIKDIINS